MHFHNVENREGVVFVYCLIIIPAKDVKHFNVTEWLNVIRLSGDCINLAHCVAIFVKCIQPYSFVATYTEKKMK